MILKQLLPAMLLFVSLASCNNESKPLNDKNGGSLNKDTLAYPFTASYSLKWQPGDEKNALLVLNCLKKYIAGDIKGRLIPFIILTTY